MQAYGYKVRLTQMDGLVAWKQLAKIFALYNPPIEWKKNLSEMYTYISNQDEKYGIQDIDQSDSSERELWEISHFFFQHVRIPPNNQDEKALLLRLIQIAYNTGQFVASVEIYKKRGFYSWLSYYHKHDMANIESYITKNSLQASKLFDKEIISNMITEIKTL